MTLAFCLLCFLLFALSCVFVELVKWTLDPTRGTIVLHKGGGAPEPEEQEMPELKPIKIPKPPKPPPPPPPLPTERASDIEQAKADQRLQERKRKGLSATLLAGETGGFTPEGKKTLLG